jgi:hypothetical protein
MTIINGYIKPRVSVREMQVDQAMRSGTQDNEDVEEIGRIKREIDRLKGEGIKMLDNLQVDIKGLYDKL